MGLHCKVVLVGDGSTGKSSLIRRLVSEGFRKQYAQTIGVDFFEKDVILRDDVAVKLEIWDVGGQSLNSKMLEYYCRAHCVLMVYDVTSRESLANVDDWLAMTSKAKKFLVGNKIDLLRHRQVSVQDHDDFWRSRNMAGGFLTSAANGDNVKRAVYHAAALALGVKLTSDDLSLHDAVVPVRLEQQCDEIRTRNADQIEAEDRAAELRLQRNRCECHIS